jgi:glycosyltransferase involved in cell wall biosynthesis
MRIIGHMVVGNELDRYLATSVTALWQVCDEVYVFDDQSTDGTFEALADQSICPCWVQRRSDNIPSFAQDESAFREAAWRWMSSTVGARAGDWVLSLDADEILVSDQIAMVPHLRQYLEGIAGALGATGSPAVTFNVRECFGFDERSHPMIRTDGYWGSIRAKRFVQWRADGTFKVRAEGGGSVPSYASNWNATADKVSIMHFGYAREEDRRVKQRRYAAGRGHNTKHVASITAAPKLERWNMPVELR